MKRRYVMDFEKNYCERNSRRFEGHWRYTLNPDEDLPSSAMKAKQHLPWPEPDPTWSDRAAFLELLHYAEAEADRFYCLGYSDCRLCGRPNGNASFQLENWVWPQGFRHYLVDHHVRPSPEFELFLGEWMQRNAPCYKWLDAQAERLPPYFKGSRWFVPALPEANLKLDAVDGRSIPCSIGFIRFLESGAFYLVTSKDKNGQQLSGANNYRLTIPAKAPVTQYWSVTSCDRTTHTPLSQWTTRASNNFGLQKNANGSVDIFFGPTVPEGMLLNWLLTDPTRPFEVMFCLSAPKKPRFKKTWVLPDIETCPSPRTAFTKQPSRLLAYGSVLVNNEVVTDE